MTVIKNGLIYDMVKDKPYKADILIQKGKIKKISLKLIWLELSLGKQMKKVKLLN